MAALIQFANGAPGIKYSLNSRVFSIGRGLVGNDISLPCGFVSKHHARIELLESDEHPGEFDYYLVDLNSTNHTYVNDKPIERVKLEDGDMVRIGKTVLKFDGSRDQAFLESVKIDLELPTMNQEKTWKLSRRLNVIGSD